MAFVSALVSAGSLLSKPLTAVPQAALDELGIEYGTPRMTGFVFIDGRYIPPPYTVTRRGNGIFINRVQIEQPVPWSYFDPKSAVEPVADLENPVQSETTQDPAALPSAQQSTESADQKIGKVSSVDDLFGDDDDSSQNNAEEEMKQPKTISSIDDLFGDNEEDVVPAPAPEKKSGEVASLDDLFSDDVPAARIPKPKTAHAKAVKHAPVELTEAQSKERKQILIKSLNDQRAFYDRALAKNELYFFGTEHHKINGTYGTARALFEVLPSALRYSRTPAELQSRLQDGGVYFLDIGVCQALYRHKMTFPLIQQRLEKIKLKESIKEAKRKKY